MAAILGGTVNDKGKGNAMMHGPGGAQKPSRRNPKEQKLAELVPSLKVLTRGAEEGDRERAHSDQHAAARTGGELHAGGFFPSGDDVISPDAYEGLEKVAVAIGKIPNPVRLEGHTDSVPIRTPRFHSNWELSAARSIALMELLIRQIRGARGPLIDRRLRRQCAHRLERHRGGAGPEPPRGHRDAE